jgi:hypothetical protein
MLRVKSKVSVVGVLFATAFTVGLAAPAQAVVATYENVETMVGQHFWTEIPESLADCPQVVSCSSRYEEIPKDVGFTVVGVGHSPFIPRVRQRADQAGRRQNRLCDPASFVGERQ